MRVPKHIGVIPDGNRRWAQGQGLSKDKGYASGIDPGLLVFKLCQKEGIEEVTYYGFTTDNAKRPAAQKDAFIKACIDAVELIAKEDSEILVMGDSKSSVFPKELLPYTTRRVFGKGGVKVNFLVNYGWEWDLNALKCADPKRKNIENNINSREISRMDLIIRWGGRRRLSGFLPVQSVYSDFYIIEDLWPDFIEKHFYDAMNWYDTQDVTLGG
ncbi:MAG: undecaprenyl diphosphate synthase family protein [Clostridium sp.]